MVQPGNITIDKASTITGLSLPTITHLSMSGMFPAILHYQNSKEINSLHLMRTLHSDRWQTILSSHYLTPEEATKLGLVTSETTLAFCVGRREYHDTEQLLRTTANYLMLSARHKSNACQTSCA